MLKGILCASIALGCVGSASVAARAQQVVHALTGTVSSIDSLTKTIILFADGGSQAEFKNSTDAKARISLDKRIRIDSVAADAFKEAGAYVIVFYFGDGNGRTAVAVRSLGKGPFTSAVGRVERFEGKDHSISVRDSSGAIQTFKIGSDTVAETGMGAAPGAKFQVEKGDQVRVVAATVDGNPTALFINAM